MHRTLILAAMALGCQSGCDRAVSKATPIADLKTTPPFIEFTHTALARLRQYERDAPLARDWYVRIEFAPGNRTPEISIETAAATKPKIVREHAEFQAGTVRCVYPKDQAKLLQGAVIDWVEGSKETGFSILFPNKTPQNEEWADEWFRGQK